MATPMCPAVPSLPTKRTQDPIVTGTSVLAIKFKGGAMIAADTLASYGSLARFMHMERLKQVGPSTIIGGSGEMSDFHYAVKTLESEIRRDYCLDDGFITKTKELWNYLNRVLYHRRNKFDPLWTDVIMIGFDTATHQSFLGLLDKVGTSFEDNYAATGYGNYLALPLLRAGWREDLTKQEAQILLEKCLMVLFMRDARSLNRIQIGTVTEAGVDISAPFQLDTHGKWGIGEMAICDRI